MPLNPAPPASPAPPALELRSLIALNLVSALAQIGQYGLGTTLLPLALQARGASAWQIGLASSALWLGMLAGLACAGQLTRRWGYRGTVVLGLLLSAAAFGATPSLPWPLWSLPAAAVGFGLGLRWIANETWLYRLAPAQAQGRVVGIHETLIGIASIAGPMIVAATGALRADAFGWAAGLTALAIPPLWAARTLAPAERAEAAQAANGPDARQQGLGGRHRIRHFIAMLGALSLGAWIAGLGGWMEGSLLALLPVHAQARGLSGEQAAWLLTLLGLGATMAQFPIGWLADRFGLAKTAALLASLVIAASALELALASQAALSVMAFAVGAAAAGMLTLGMVHAAQGSDSAAITARVQQVSMLYTLLSAGGPLLAGWVLSASGRSAWLMVLQLAAAVVLLGLVARQSRADARAQNPGSH